LELTALALPATPVCLSIVGTAASGHAARWMLVDRDGSALPDEATGAIVLAAAVSRARKVVK
jgi:hypothetical protein